MEEKEEEHLQGVRKLGRKALSSRGLLAIAGVLVLIIALLVGSNVGGLREELLWQISPPRINSVAVLPLESLSPDPDQDYFAYGMTMRLAGELQRFAAFQTIAPFSAARYRKSAKPLSEIARELNVAALVQGSTMRSGDRGRISVSLIHAPTGRRLWDQSYERDFGDIPKLEAEIARAIALEIKAAVKPGEEARLAATRRVDPGALEAMLRGMCGICGGRENPANAEEYMKQAIRLDSSYAAPHGYLANMYWMRNMYHELPPAETYPAAKASAQTALGLDPIAIHAHRILALAVLEYDWDFVEAEKQFKRAFEITPNGANIHHMYSHFLLSLGRMEEAEAGGRRAMELNPLSSDFAACLSWHDIAAGEYEEAEQRSLQALSMGAPDRLARLTLGWSYALRGRHDQAIPEFQKAVVGWKRAVFPTAVLGHGYAAAGKEDAAREVLNELLARSRKEYVSPYEIAMVYAGLGDRERAFEWLEKAYEERSGFLVYFRMDPRIRGLQSDERFRELLRRMNFPRDGR